MSQEVSMLVRDYGEGFPKDMLANFEANGSQVGVGLAGISERMREFGGKWDLKSSSAGTEITVRIPLSANSDVAREQRHRQHDPIPGGD